MLVTSEDGGDPVSAVGGRDDAGEPDWEQWRRPAPSPTQRRRDIGLALGVLAGAWLSLLLISSMGAFVFGSAPSLPEQFLWAAAMTLPLAVRRRYPLIVLAVVGAFFILGQVRQIGDNFAPSVVLFIAIYTAGAWSANRVAAWWVRVTVIAVMFGWLAISIVMSFSEPQQLSGAGPFDPVLASILYNIGFNLLFFFGAHYFGDVDWLSARRRARLEHQAWRLRRSQEENVRGALVAERMRIARDLHDVVAHHVSVVGVQAGAARLVLDTDTELARSTLRTVEDNARTAISELRGLLGVLRSGHDQSDASDGEGEARTASPGLDQLPELVATARSAGLRVEYGVYGDARPVPDSVGLTVYRIVQEALTNTVKHAGPVARADVRIRWLERVLEVEVSDDGKGVSLPEEDSMPRGGFGLMGMRERVAVHGGELETGPRRGGGFRVRATLPVPRDDRASANHEARAK